MLILSQPGNSAKDTLHPRIIADEMINNQNIPSEDICLATGDERWLEANASCYRLGLNDPSCPVKYIITRKALAESWDCPWAYVLVSVTNISSSTAVEHLLGRILRQPAATAKKEAALNQSYAFITSHDFSSTAQALADQLVNVAGFERKDAGEFISENQ